MAKASQLSRFSVHCGGDDAAATTDAGRSWPLAGWLDGGAIPRFSQHAPRQRTLTFDVGKTCFALGEVQDVACHAAPLLRRLGGEEDRSSRLPGKNMLTRGRAACSTTWRWRRSWPTMNGASAGYRRASTLCSTGRPRPVKLPGKNGL